MASRYRPLALYTIVLAVGTAVWLWQSLGDGAAFPPIWAVALLILACLFVWQFGLPAPRVGLTSMERLPQIGLLLALDPPIAASICAAASFLWPLLNRTYSHRSLRMAALRAVHNASMTAMMLMLGARAYEAAGGHQPLDGLDWGDVWPLAAMALTVQAVNVVLMALYFRFDGRDVRKIIRPVYTLVDLIFVPAGVLAALLWVTRDAATFALFAGLMVVFVLSFNGIGRSLGTAESDNAPLARLAHARRALHGARRIDELSSRILTETRALFRFDEFYLVLVDPAEHALEMRVHERRGERMPVRSKPVGAGLFGWVVESAEPVLVEDWARAPAALRQRAELTEKETGSLIAVPLVEDGLVIGLLSVQHTRQGVYSDADLHLMQRLAEQVAVAVADARAFEDLEDYRQRLEERVAERTQELEQANREKERLITALGERSRKLERESQEDPLTGIANRRCFTQRLEAEIEVARAVGQPLTLAVADLDHFKVVNDELGHSVGDEVLRQSALVMRGLCRSTDLVARIGGEEFALLLPGMAREAALAFCENLRHAVESHDWRPVHPRLAITLSIGLYQWDGASDEAELLQAADTQLYEAKNRGRNRVA